MAAGILENLYLNSLMILLLKLMCCSKIAASFNGLKQIDTSDSPASLLSSQYEQEVSQFIQALCSVGVARDYHDGEMLRALNNSQYDRGALGSSLHGAINHSGNNAFLHEEKENYSWKNCHQQSGKCNIPLLAILTEQGIDRKLDRPHLWFLNNQQRQHVLIPAPDGFQQNNRDRDRPHQREYDLPVHLIWVAAIYNGRFLDLFRDRFYMPEKKKGGESEADADVTKDQTRHSVNDLQPCELLNQREHNRLHRDDH